jgi:hypothetical protein
MGNRNDQKVIMGLERSRASNFAQIRLMLGAQDAINNHQTGQGEHEAGRPGPEQGELRHDMPVTEKLTNAGHVIQSIMMLKCFD